MHPQTPRSFLAHQERPLEGDLEALQVVSGEVNVLLSFSSRTRGVLGNKVDVLLVDNRGGETSTLGNHEVVNVSVGAETLDVGEDNLLCDRLKEALSAKNKAAGRGMGRCGRSECEKGC